MLPLPVHSYALNARSAASSRLVNVYAEGAGEKSPVLLRTVPGIRALTTLAGAGRGMHVWAGKLYVLAGTQLYSVNKSGVASLVGEIPGTQRATFANNETQLLISADGSAYVLESGLTRITDADFLAPNAGVCAFLDSYALFVDEGSGRFFASNFDDFTEYDALDFATAESSPDDLITLAVDHRQAVLIGKESVELWWNSGASGFPFERVPNGIIELGGLAKYGVCKQDNSVFWLASDRTARRLNGATPQRVSSHGVEEKWRDYATVDDCVAFPFTSTGHLFVCFRFPSAGATWVYDCTTNEWHERESYLGLPWRVSASATWDGTTYVQDDATGSVGVLDGETFTEWGDTLRAEWTYQGLWNGGRRVFHQELELGIETGVGLATGQGDDPMLTLHTSDDGGRTFRSISVKSIGRMGEYKKRVRWHRLGSASHRVYRVSFSDPVPLTVWDTQTRVASE